MTPNCVPIFRFNQLVDVFDEESGLRLARGRIIKKHADCYIVTLAWPHVGRHRFHADNLRIVQPKPLE